jgi:autotransporter-associated beta strand protein
MKPTRNPFVRAALASAIVITAGQSIYAAGGSWNVNNPGDWSTASNWTPAAIPGTTAGDVVNLQFNITAARTVTINTTSRIVGDLNIGDPTATLFSYTLAASGSAALQLDGTGSTAGTVDFTAAIANTISSPITLVDNGVFRSNVNAVMTMSGIISGASKTLTFNNDTNGTANAATASQGQFSLTGANTYSGGTSISDVRVAVGTSATALGSGAVSIASGGQVFLGSALTLANNFSIAGNGWVETAAGHPFGALRLDNGTVSGTVTMTAAAAVGNNSGTGTISGVISGSFPLTKRGAGTIVLTRANTFTGGVNIANGVLQLNNNSAAGPGEIALTTGGNTTTGTRVAINGGVTIANNITIPATTGAAGRGNIEYSGTTGAATVNGSISITGGPNSGGHLYGGPSAVNVLHLAGPITSTVPFSQRDRFVKYSGGGTGYSGTVTITGTAIVGADNGISTAANLLLGGSGAANLDLNGFNQSLTGISRNANTCVIGNSSTTSDSTLTITGTSTYSGNITDVIGNGTRKVGITVSGGTLALSGTNTHSGATTVSSGALLVTTATAIAPNSPLSVANGTKFSYQPNAIGAVTMGAASNTFAGGSALGVALGGSVGECAMNFPAAVTASGNITLDVWAVPGASIAEGTHTLVSAPLGGLLGATYTLGSFLNSSDSTIGNLVVTDTAITIDVTAASPLLTAFWKGGLAGSPSVWSASNGSTQSNWVATSGGSDQALVPGALADVVFSNSTVTTAPTAITLGSNVAAKSLTISDTTNGLGIAAVPANSSNLTIGEGGLSMASGVPASSIAVPVIVTADQTWTNNSENPLSLTSSLNGSTFGFTKNGTGAITVSGASTFGFDVNVNAGALTLTSGTIAGSPVTVASGASFTSGAAINGSGSLSTTGTTTISGANNYNGVTDVLGGTLTMTGGTIAGSAITVASGATFTQTGGVISGASGLSTAGTTTLAGNNTFTGDVDLTGGILSVALTNALTGHLGASAAPATQSKYINFSNGATLLNTNTFNNNVGSATVRQFVFNFGTGGGILDVPATFSLVLDDGAVVSNANNAAQLQGSGNLTKIGDGILSLGNGTSDFSGFTGQIFVNAGTLTTGAVSISPFGDSAAGTTVASGATADLKGVSVGAEPFIINGDGVALGGALISSAGTGSTSGPITIATNSSIGGAGNLALSGALSGTGALTKIGAGSASFTGDVSGFSGGLTLSAGSLTVPDTMSVADLTLTSGSLYGEITSTSMTLDGGTIFFDPNSADTLATGALTVNGAVVLDVTTLPPTTTVPVITSTSLAGAGTFTVANAANYRTIPVVNTSATGVTVTFGTGKALTWTGTTSGVWDINATTNWNNGVGADVFYSGDSVTFPEGGLNPEITLAGLISPAGVVVNSSTTNYTLTSTTGNQLTGATGISKTGASTLTLVGANLNSGITSIGGGILSIAGTNSIGNSIPGNSIALSGGGQLRYTGTTAANFGTARNVTVGTGGGVISHNSGTAATLSFSGALSGTAPLSFLTEGAGTGTYSLSGNNSGYTGDITLNAMSTGLTTVILENQAAVPASGSITINHPALGAAAGNANTLNLRGLTTPAGLDIALTCGLNGALSMRSQITYNGDVVVNSPLKLTGGGSIIQISGTGSLTLNGNITEATPGSFGTGNTLFPRGTSPIILNGTVNLPGAVFAHTEAGVLTINSTGNIWGITNISQGSMVLGTTDALATGASLNLGQNDAVACTLNMAGFNQTVAGLISNPIAVGANTTGKVITSADSSILTSSPIADVTYAGLITGNVSLVKQGSFTQTLLGSSTTFGDITVDGGTLAANASAGTGTALGAASDTRIITVNNTGILSFGAANVLTSNFSSISVPSLVINAGGTVTNNVAGNNALGNVTLNGGTLTATDGHATYGAFNINGDIISTGTSTISRTGSAVMMLTSQGANGVNTASNIEVTSGTLTISAPLGDLAVAESKISGLNKTGSGTLVLSGANFFTGGTTVAEGTLELTDDAQLKFVLGATSGTTTNISGAGTVTLSGDFVIDTTAADALFSGTWLIEDVTSLTGAYGSTFTVVGFADIGSNKWEKTVGIKKYTFDETTGILTLESPGYSSWATTNGAGANLNDDHDNDGVANGIEYFIGGPTGNTTGFTPLPGVVNNSGTLSVTWTKAPGYTGVYGTDFVVETSATLSGVWTPQTATPTAGFTVTFPSATEVKFTFPAGTTNFARLKVTGP